MDGGAGNDTYVVDDLADVVREATGDGSDTVIALVTYTLAPTAEVETLQAVGAGTGPTLNPTGNGFANTIIGNANDNVLDGRGGADRLVGLGGNDAYVVDNVGDQVVEEAGGGIDEIRTSFSDPRQVDLVALQRRQR
jgi:Ca2+-binding RTX toxin-like protein